MEEIYALLRYLPIYPQEEEEYVKFIKNEIEKSFNAGAYQSAYLTAHMIFMYYVYNCIWKIKYYYTDRYCYGVIGFPKYRDGNNDDVDLRKLDSVFDLSLVAEKTVFDMFQLIDMEKSVIKRLKNAVDKRNNIAHSTGQITFSTVDNFSEGIKEIISNCNMIHDVLEKNIIRPAYERFLLSNTIPDDWEYSEIDEQVKQLLLYSHKISEVELDSCCAFGLSRFTDRIKYSLNHEEIQTIKKMHESVKLINSDLFGKDDVAV